ncbi:MAG: rhodanese-like domain-containing protein [Desulfobacterales bacterium]|nr:rhodanese-like domain-containing protein [Desulfobacterales bacterium]
MSMRKLRCNFFLLFLITGLLLLSGCVAATADKATPMDTSWHYHSIVDAAFVKEHMKVPMPETTMFIDSRPYKTKYVKGHIPGAVNIPLTEFDKKKDLLPKDKNALLVFYCGGPKCKLSHKSAVKAEKLGYTNVKVYALGYPDWMAKEGSYASVSAEYVADKIAGNKAMIIDSRPQMTKYNKSHIPSAINIPFTHFDSLKGKLPRDPDTPLIFYCGGLKCKLSHKSAVIAREMGYTNVAVFAKGYPEWKKQFGAAGEAIAVTAGEIEGTIDPERFNEIIAKNPGSITLIDVRDPDEFAAGHIKTAVNIPVESLEPRIKDLPGDKPIIYVCTTGARSGEAYYMTLDVREELKEVYYVEAEIDFKKDGSYDLKAASNN